MWTGLSGAVSLCHPGQFPEPRAAPVAGLRPGGGPRAACWSDRVGSGLPPGQLRTCGSALGVPGFSHGPDHSLVKLAQVAVLLLFLLEDEDTEAGQRPATAQG